jgi:hypothetical protein
MAQKAAHDGDNVDGSENPLKTLAEDLGLIVRKELELARTEIAEKAKTAGIGAGMLSGSAVTGALALTSLTICAILALSLIVAPWIAAAIVTLVWSAVTVALVLAGKKKIADAGSLLPEKTIKNVREDVKWAQQQVFSNKK